MNFTGPATRLSSGDVTTIAGYLGCEIAAVRAVLAVETTGSGFHGGRPIILFEPHVFYRELDDERKRERAMAQGLAYRKWGARPYPKTQAERYAQLQKAMAIDETAALRSASWGLGQVMGFNHAACGFDTVQQFVRAMTVSEGAQLYAMARFIVTNGLQRHLRKHDWAKFARGYNGSGYAKHGYHTKLANAYAKRPAGEKRIPSPATMEQLQALISSAAQPQPPEPKPTPQPKPKPEPTRPPAEPPQDMNGAGGKIVAGLLGIVMAGAAVLVVLLELLGG